MPVALNGCRDGSRTAATSKMELFVITVNGFEPLIIITKCSILDVVRSVPGLVPSVISLLFPRTDIMSHTSFITFNLLHKKQQILQKLISAPLVFCPHLS